MWGIPVWASLLPTRGLSSRRRRNDQRPSMPPPQPQPPPLPRRIPSRSTITHPHSSHHYSWGPAVTRHTRTFTRLPSHDPPTTVTKHPLSHPVTLCTTQLGNIVRHQREKVPMARRTYVLPNADAVSRRGRIVVIELPLCWESANVTHSTI